MSYDLDIGDEDFNITYNISYIFHSQGKNLRDLNGMKSGEALDWLRDVRKNIEDNWGYYERREWEYCKGWGSVEGTYDFVQRLIRACLRNPNDEWLVG